MALLKSLIQSFFDSYGLWGVLILFLLAGGFCLLVLAKDKLIAWIKDIFQ